MSLGYGVAFVRQPLNVGLSGENSYLIGPEYGYRTPGGKPKKNIQNSNLLNYFQVILLWKFPEKKRELGAAQSEIKALKTTDVLKDMALEEVLPSPILTKK